MKTKKREKRRKRKGPHVDQRRCEENLVRRQYKALVVAGQHPIHAGKTQKGKKTRQPETTKKTAHRTVLIRMTETKNTHTKRRNKRFFSSFFLFFKLFNIGFGLLRACFLFTSCLCLCPSGPRRTPSLPRPTRPPLAAAPRSSYRLLCRS